MLRKIFLVLFSIFVLNSQALTPKDTIVVAVENEPKRINPIFSEDHDAAIALIFSGLTRFDEKMNIKPDLAKSWKISKDGLVYEFDLREDVLWHDGEKFSAKDVKFSLEAFKNKKLNTPVWVNFEMIEDIKIINDYKIKITLKEPFPAFLDVLSLGVLPKHLLENKDLNKDIFNQKPIGTGPFKFKEWKKGQYLSLEANENYHLGKVGSKKLILKFISDPSIAALELKNSSVDVAVVDATLAKNFENDANFNVLKMKGADYRALMFNFENELFKDKKVRLALNYAVNKAVLIDSLLHGYGFVANQPLQLSWASPKENFGYAYDMKKAQSLLEEAGWAKNQKGILEKDGKEFEFEMYAMSDDPLRVALVNFLQSELRKIGIKARAMAKPRGSFDYSKVDSFLVGWGSPYDPDLHTFRVFSSIGDTKNNAGGWNYGHYENAKVDKTLLNARSVLDIDKRKKHYEEFIKALNEDPAYIFLVYLEFPVVAAKNIQGLKATTLGHHGVGFTFNAYEWSKN
ncbi:ABC transporter substrate-binding protein [Campylobacter sp. CCS1377]|uniref:ABC transporter substrate-binding protein n=1 Tax=Campylobacter sp. CCS1377 TaxID=3158229 RepID=A0AAU7E7R0_9BACT